MPRDLADVLHYFLPELDGPEDSAALANTPETPEPRETPEAQPVGAAKTRRAPAVPILGLPIGQHDIVRAALAWNLAIEVARLGATSIFVTPDSDRGSPLWPAAGVGPLGCELHFCPATDAPSLQAAAKEIAAARTGRTESSGVVFVRVPPEWLLRDPDPAASLPWVLLLSSPNPRDLQDTFDWTHQLATRSPNINVGVTVHGVSTITEARTAFDTLSRRLEAALDYRLTSYGLLVDDLDVYRAIAAQRPIGLVHPQAPATRALADVARLIVEDAGSRSDA